MDRREGRLDQRRGRLGRARDGRALSSVARFRACNGRAATSGRRDCPAAASPFAPTAASTTSWPSAGRHLRQVQPFRRLVAAGTSRGAGARPRNDFYRRSRTGAATRGPSTGASTAAALPLPRGGGSCRLDCPARCGSAEARRSAGAGDCQVGTHPATGATPTGTIAGRTPFAPPDLYAAGQAGHRAAPVGGHGATDQGRRPDLRCVRRWQHARPEVLSTLRQQPRGRDDRCRRARAVVPPHIPTAQSAGHGRR